MLILGLFATAFLLMPTATFDSRQAGAAEPTTMSGTVSVLIGDPRGATGLDPTATDTTPRRAYYLTDSDGKTWLLNISEDVIFTAGGAAAITNKQVDVTGVQTSEHRFAVQAISPSGTTSSSATAGSTQPFHPGAAVTGTKVWYTLLCKFADVAAEPEALTFFDDMMSDIKPGANHYWKELSYENIDLDGSMQFDWLDLPDNRDQYIDDTDPDNQGSDRTKLFDDCKQAHEDNGVDFTGVFGINLMFNDDLDCCAWGGSSGGFAATWMPPWAWGNSTDGHGVLGQEMGHAFGLPHEGCEGTESPYDSLWDVMSAAPQVHTNAAFKDALGWVDGTLKYTADNSANQVVEIERLALPQIGNFHPDQFLMVEIPLTANTYYTLETRKFAGYDDTPAQVPAEGVVLHFVDDTLGDKNAVVVHDGDNDDDCNDDSGVFTVGELFIDSGNGISFIVQSETDNGFVVAINPNTDVAISKTASPSPVIAGNQITYSVTVDNLGPGVASNVMVTDTLPAGVTYVADTDSCAEGPPGTLTCTAPAPIGPGDSWTFDILANVDSAIVNGLQGTITNTATVTADQDMDGSNNTISLTTFVISEADLAVTKICKPDTPAPTGSTAFCDIFIDNLGPSMANSVTLNDVHLSAGTFNITSIDETQGSCVESPQGTVNCTLNNIDAGDRVTVTVEFTSNDPVDVNDKATVDSDTPDPDTTNNMDEGSVSFVGSADLSITKSDLPDPVIAGTQLTYMLAVVNSGPSTAMNVVVEDQVPAGVEMDSVNPSQGNCTAGDPGNPANPTTCQLGNLPSGAGATVTIVVNVLPDTLGLLHNDASVSSDTADPNNGNNVDTEDTTVNGEADLSIEKADSPDPVIAGDPLTYILTVTNNGPSTAQDVMVSDTLPTEVSFNSATADNGGLCVEVNPGVVECELGDMQPNDAVNIYIDVTVAPDTPAGDITNNASVSSATTDSNSGNDTVVETTTVNTAADVWLDKTSNFPTGNASGTIIYYLTVYNLEGCSEDDPLVCGPGGPSAAENVMVMDPLPSTAKKFVVEFVSEECSYDKPSHTVTCTEPVLPYGEFVTFEIQVKAKGNLGLLTNTATVTTDNDPDASNNTDSLDLLVQGGSGDGGGPGGGRGRGGGPK